MARLWLLAFTLALGVAFKAHREDQWKIMPYAEKYKSIPADVFYYDFYEHVGKIITAGIFISMIIWSPERRHLPGYIIYFAIELMDVVLWRFYYRGWMFESFIPWNITKNLFFCLTILSMQWKQYLARSGSGS